MNRLGRMKRRKRTRAEQTTRDSARTNRSMPKMNRAEMEEDEQGKNAIRRPRPRGGEGPEEVTLTPNP